MPPYTPGYFAPSTLPGAASAPSCDSSPNSASTFLPALHRAPDAVSHRSGRHSSASAPHTSLFRFAPRMEMSTFVPAGTGTDVVSSPETVRTGNRRGRTVSLVVLKGER